MHRTRRRFVLGGCSTVKGRGESGGPGDRIPSGQARAKAISGSAITTEWDAAASELDYRDAVMATVDGILVVDQLRTGVGSANPAAERLLGTGGQLKATLSGFLLLAKTLPNWITLAWMARNS